jgi:hypothetical protein
MTVGQMEALLTEQEKCPWIIKIQLFKCKTHFLKYAGRYVKRPPIAQRRITVIGERTVRFWFKDKKLRRRVEVECSLEEFIDRWAQHIPELCQHTVRSFGLFASALSQPNLGSSFYHSETGAKTRRCTRTGDGCGASTARAYCDGAAS